MMMFSFIYKNVEIKFFLLIFILLLVFIIIFIFIDFVIMSIITFIMEKNLNSFFFVYSLFHFLFFSFKFNF